ncbi:cell wall metabolism sensor histidine kinase WalK [Aeromicrobium sp. Leaf350]|uniref:sensor histidine kinase n=1 Tax=Aeromicrobium sp. Leaf350 TaxID=2876565 RepID=UPI001E5DFDE4|nr:ATP-binding protein [Aeromicrobium sp. Leaf350]
MAPRLLDRLSVRARLTLAVTAWTTIALTVTGLALDRVADHRVLSDATDTTQRTITAFRDVLEEQPETAATDLVETFARDAVLGPDVSAVAVVDGEATSGAGTPADRLVLAESSAASLPDGGSTMLREGGQSLSVSVLEVRGEAGAAHLVVLNDVDKAMDSLDDLMVTYALICLLVLIVTALSAWWTAGRILSPLRRLHRTAASITAGDLDRRVTVTGRDDMSRLQETVNSMLDRLEVAFATQRDLLDDVSHELRTPLTVMRGHLETAEGADARTVAEIHEIVVEEIERTTRLVGDLGVLADARRPDFVRRRHTDLADLVERIAQKSAVLGDRSWSHEVTSSRVVEIDAERITQAVLQLVENAVSHTEPGDPVAITGAADHESVTITVRDGGTGVDPSDRELIFRRFGRGRADRSGAPGHGLGLAIVTAIVESHGGDLVLLDAEPGRPGAAFRITLPVGAS